MSGTNLLVLLNFLSVRLGQRCGIEEGIIFCFLIVRVDLSSVTGLQCARLLCGDKRLMGLKLISLWLVCVTIDRALTQFRSAPVINM